VVASLSGVALGTILWLPLKAAEPSIAAAPAFKAREDGGWRRGVSTGSAPYARPGRNFLVDRSGWL
jgi:hypothetical protein